MRKKSHVALLCITALTLCTANLAYATDLPIDINAIRRNEAREDQITTRIGAHLFTADGERVNYAMAEQMRLRQSTAQYLFETVPPNYEIEPHTQLLNAAVNSALFAQPASFSNITPPQPAGSISIWVVIPIIALCAAGGFVWALVSGAKKKGQQERVH